MGGAGAARNPTRPCPAPTAKGVGANTGLLGSVWTPRFWVLRGLLFTFFSIQGQEQQTTPGCSDCELCLPHRTTLAPRSCVRWPGTWAGLTPGTRATSTPWVTSSPSWPPWYEIKPSHSQKNTCSTWGELCSAGLSIHRFSPTNPLQGPSRLSIPREIFPSPGPCQEVPVSGTAPAHKRHLL